MVYNWSVLTNNNYVYDVARDDYETATNLSKEQWKRVSLLSYYGY